MNTTRMAIRILVVEDQREVRNLISLALKHQGYSADFSDDTDEAVAKLHDFSGRYAAVLIDLGMHGDVTTLAVAAHTMSPLVPVIGLVDCTTSVTDRLQIDEIICKPLNGENLRKAVQGCLRRSQSSTTNQDEVSRVTPDAQGASSLWRNESQTLIRHVAAADVSVLIQGETGSGKEVLARQLHALSARAKKPFLKVNCAALPSELIESELFGYERGAFTGAFKTTAGKFEVADSGTILLDEIGDMEFKLQAKLLQVLQDSEFIRLGSSEPRRVNVRVIAATHCDLERAITEGRFREDLYYRLNIVTLHVPALRDRRDEILPLAHYFLRKHETPETPSVEITPMLREVLLSHDWPGNIRELENIIRRLLVVRRPELVSEDIRKRSRRRSPAPLRTPSATIEAPANVPPQVFNGVERRTYAAAAGQELPFPSRMRSHSEEAIHEAAPLSTAPSNDTPRLAGVMLPAPLGVAHHDRSSILERVDSARRDAETEAIVSALNSTLWNRKRAAELLNIDYKALLYKMKKLEIVDRAAQIAI